MIGTLARKRTNLVALTALLALVAAMFVAMQPTGAQVPVAVGNVSATSGYCQADADPATRYDIRTGAVGSTFVTVDAATTPNNAADDVDSNRDGIQHAISCAAANATQAVKVTPNGSTSPTVEVLTPTLDVSFSGVVKAGSSVTVKAQVKNAKFNTTYAYVSTSASPAGAGSAVNIKTVGQNVVAAPTAAENIATLLVPPTSSGTINVLVTAGSATSGYLFGQASITVGEATAPAASQKAATATLSLGNSADENPNTTAKEAKPEDDTAKAGETIWLVLTVTDASGNPTPDANINGVTFVSFDATTLEVYNATPTAPGNPLNRSNATGATSGSNGIANHAVNAVAPEHTAHVKVGRATAGTVSIYARVDGTDNNPVSNVLTLKFTGASTEIAVSDAPDRLAQTGAKAGESDSFKVNVTGKDKNGNTGSLTATGLNLRVLDADGEVAKNLTATATQAQTAAETDDETKVEIEVKTDANPKKAAAGDYMLEVLLNGNAKTKQTVAFSVSGPAANVAITADPETSSTVGEVVDLAATVTDANGTNVPDGTPVKFSATQGGGAAIISAADTTTKDGMVTASLGVSSHGTTFVYATSGAARGTLTFVSSAGAPEPAPEPEPETVSLDCLSNLTQFSAYTCGVDSLASELFALLSTRGATAIHLNSGGSWVRYSIVDGSEVPGSSDFVVTTNDILYISN